MSSHAISSGIAPALHAEVFIAAPSAPQTLHRAVVVAVHTGSVDIKFDESVDWPTGIRVYAYYKLIAKRVRAGATMQEVVDSPSGPAFRLVHWEIPSPCEARRTFRKTLASVRCTCRIDDELLDVTSVTFDGFAAVGAALLEHGSMCGVELSFEGTSFSGQATVRNSRRLGPNRTRFGFEALKNARALRRGLQKITSEIDRRHRLRAFLLS